VKRWGGQPEDYLPIHQFFDESKMCLADVRHRALRHHTEGIFLAERVFGTTLTNSAGRVIPVRWIGEQHVQEDLGWIPTVKDWLENLEMAPWMHRTGKLPLSAEERKQGEVPDGEAEACSEQQANQKAGGQPGCESSPGQ
jgi:hypothetical protein